MKTLKRMVKNILTALGYEFYNSGQAVSYNNFTNLAQAYEQQLNDLGCSIIENEIRVNLISKSLGTPPSEAYFIVKALAECKDVKGDVCEFGVAQGQTSALIANEIQCSDKILHLFDSFEGLPMPTAKDQLKDDIYSLGDMDSYAGKMSCPEEMVRTRLEEISFPLNRTVIHKGFIEKVLGSDLNLPEKVSFAYLDFDFYEPIKTGLEFLHQVTSAGSVIIVDDYDFFSTGSKTAVDEFIEEKNLNEMIYECYIPDTRYGYFAVVTRKSN